MISIVKIAFVLSFILKISIEDNYRERLAELQDQNERKDLRIRLLENKLQKLQVFIYIILINIENRIFFSFSY